MTVPVLGKPVFCLVGNLSKMDIRGPLEQSQVARVKGKRVNALISRPW